MQRDPRRWRTSFGRWVRSYGAPRLATDLQRAGVPVTQWAVYHWLSGTHAPRPDHAAAIVRLSRGSLSIDDVYRHRVVVRERLFRDSNERQRGCP